MSSSAAHPDGAWCFDVLTADAIDGDTARVTADLGFGAAFRFDLRLRNVSAPELREVGGPEAKTAFQAYLDQRPLLVTTYRTVSGGEVRSFARWLGRLTIWPDRDVGEEMVLSGHAKVTVL